MHLKQLLNFQDVAIELGCDDQTVRSLVVEDQSLPAIFVPHIGHKEPYSASQRLMVGVDGLAFDFQDPNHHIGALRVQRSDLDAFKTQHEQRLKAATPTAVTKLEPTAETTCPNIIDAPPDASEVATMPADRAIAIMAWLLSENKPAMQIGDRPNAAAIGTAVNDLAKKRFGNDVRGFAAFHKRVAQALKTLDPETAASVTTRRRK